MEALTESQIYKGEDILESFYGRMMPPDRNYSDCDCVIYLTKSYIYVMEDNLDGTYEELFCFPIYKVIDVNSKTNTMSSDSDALSKTGLNTINDKRTLPIIEQLFGLRRSRKITYTYCYIKYQGDNEPKSLYFEKPSGKVDRFILTFTEVKYGVKVDQDS